MLGSSLAHLSPLSWLADYPDPQDFLSLLVHSGMTVNQTHISLPEGDTLLDQADATSDQAQRLRLYQRAEQIYVTNVAWIPLTQALNAYVVRDKGGRRLSAA